MSKHVKVLFALFLIAAIHKSFAANIIYYVLAGSLSSEEHVWHISAAHEAAKPVVHNIHKNKLYFFEIKGPNIGAWADVCFSNNI